MSEIGNFLLLTTMFSSVIGLSFVFDVIPAKAGIHKKSLFYRLDSYLRGNDHYLVTLPFYIAASCTILTFCILVYAFIISDFLLQNVFLNSSTLKPLIYKIAGSWSSQEGSMLLWFCLLQIVSCCYIFLLEDNQLKFFSIIILSIVQLFFSSFIYFISNPFNVFSFVPKEGLGLNPMLQDIALSLHPPLLYLGYVSYVVPFTIVCASMLFPRRREPINDTRLLKTFSNIGILFTTIGISLGSWWAYRELGWGGFWFFDPVENISLFPWLSGIMLHHSIMVTSKTNRIERLQNWTIILSIVTFLLVIFSTFLVRSGFITSIHSFTFSPERGMYLLGIFLIVGIGSIGLYTTMSLRGDALALMQQPQKTSRDCRSHFRRLAMMNCGNAILLGNIFFLLSLIVLIAATLYQPIYSLFDDKPIIISETFFVNNFIIFVIPILYTIGLFTTRSSIKKHITILILSLIITYLISLKVTFSVISILTIIASIFLMLHNVHYLLVKTNYFRNRLKADSASMILGHFGFALVSFSITMNALLQSEMDFTGRVGTSKIFNEFKVTLQNIKFAQGKNYYRQIAEFWFEDNRSNITILKPENRFYVVEKRLSQESDIYSYLSYDLYAVLSNIDGDVIHAKIYYKPMMSFIWLGIILTASGFFIALIRKNSG